MLEQMFGKERVACCHSIKGRRSRPAEGGEGRGISICWRIANFRRRKGLDSEIQDEEEEEEVRQQKRKRRIGDAERWKRGGEKRKRDSEKKFFIFPGKRSECASEKKSSPICCWGKKLSPSCRCVAKGIRRHFSDMPQYIFYLGGIWEITRAVFLEFSGGGHP